MRIERLDETHALNHKEQEFGVRLAQANELVIERFKHPYVLPFNVCGNRMNRNLLANESVQDAHD